MRRLRQSSQYLRDEGGLMRRATVFLCFAVTIGATACSDQNPNGALEALAEGDLAIAKEIYVSGVDPDEMVKGQTALTIVACHSSAETVEMLLDVGADPNLASRRRKTPLIYAAGCGNLPVVRVLLEAGADPNIAAPGGETAISAARAAGEEAVVQLLLEAGAEAEPVKSAVRRKATGL